jgi:hypothetical protein
MKLTTKREEPHLKALDSPLTAILINLQRRKTTDTSLGRHGNKTVQKGIITEMGAQNPQMESAVQILLANGLQSSWVQAIRGTYQRRKRKGRMVTLWLLLDSEG